jgi:hypothetical protein
MKLRIVTRVFVPSFVITMLAIPLSAQDWGEKMFDRPQVAFGSVARLADTTFNVKVTNPYVEEIRITSLTTSCGCISWTVQAPISIPSKAERHLTIRLDTVRHVGEKHVKAFVTLNEPIKGLTSIVTIPVEGRIRNDVEVQPSSVGFGAVELGRGYTQRISITYKGEYDWKILSAKVGSHFLATQVAQQTRERGTVRYEVTVELKPDAPVGVLRDRLILTTNEVAKSEISIPVEARIEPDIVVSDAQFGTVALGQPKSITVILRGKKPFFIKKAEHASHPAATTPESDKMNLTRVPSDPRSTEVVDSFKIDFANTNTQVHTMKLTVLPGKESGKFDEDFSVTISGRVQPVTFIARGRILDQFVINASR